MSKTEKTTTNLGVVDLGKIDLLVEQGHYSNRTDFIKTAVRNQLSRHSEEIQNTITKKNFAVGILYISKDDLETYLLKNQQVDIKVIGKLIFNDDITPELAVNAIRSIKILGSISASPEVAGALEEKISKML